MARTSFTQELKARGAASERIDARGCAWEAIRFMRI
jgi:hypothetical protein